MTNQTPLEVLRRHMGAVRPIPLEVVARTLHPHQDYRGNLKQIFDELTSALETDTPDLVAAVHRVLHPPRILRGVIDYRIENPQFDTDDELLLRTTRMALDIYEGMEVERFATYRKAFPNEASLIKKEIIQEADIDTCLQIANLSDERTGEILDLTAYNPILFLGIGHGGIVPGLKTFNEIVGVREGSYFHPVRFSREKHKDKNPQLRNSEIITLRKRADGREIVIYDEDTSTGGTLAQAYRYFATDIFPGREIVVSANNVNVNRLSTFGYHIKDKPQGRYHALNNLGRTISPEDIDMKTILLLGRIAETDPDTRVRKLAKHQIEQYTVHGAFR